ncbi:MAG TPA: hypothetical protein VJB90_01350 [Candidatus Nanoarchaeia archaeon]|nr:hypothetical protein [Candidatus Nanoarchaeia archaeon]
MKKLIPFIVFLLVVSSVYGSVFEKGEELNRAESIKGNYYATAAIVQLSAPVSGDVIAAAGNVTISNSISGDVMIAAGQASISGNVLGDARIAAGKAELSGIVDGDAIIFAGEADLRGKVKGDALIEAGAAKIGDVGGSLHVDGGTVKINGIINGSATINADMIEFTNGSKILGDLNYSSTKRVDDKFVGGKITYIEKKQSFFESISGTIFAFGSALLLGMLLLFFLQEKTIEAADRLMEKPLQVLLVGVLALIVIPIIAIILLFTIVGIPISIMIIVAFIALLYFGKILLALGAGRKIFPNNIHFALLAGLILYYLLKFLPGIGFLLAVAGAVLGLGTIVLGFMPKKGKKKRR